VEESNPSNLPLFAQLFQEEFKIRNVVKTLDLQRVFVRAPANMRSCCINNKSCQQYTVGRAVPP
jgi:hypothetical protein